MTLVVLPSSPNGARGKVSVLTPLALLLVLSCPALSRADVGLLRTVQALDEVRGY